MTEHRVSVREAAPSDVPVRIRRRGIGRDIWDTRHSAGGYIPFCSCGWVGELAARATEAHAIASGHEGAATAEASREAALRWIAEHREEAR